MLLSTGQSKRREKMKLILTLFITTWMARFGLSIIGYDCGSSRLNITTISLVDVDECEASGTTQNITKVHLHLLQLNEFTKTQVKQCKIVIQRTISYCGMHSHASAVAQGQLEYVYDIGMERCRKLHTTGVLQFNDNVVIGGIKINATNYYGVTLGGSITRDGHCKGTQYTDPYGTWDNVVVQGTVKITLQDYYATVNLNTNRINLRSGVACSLSEGECTDLEGGYTFWNILPEDKCGFTGYGVLYEGPGHKIRAIDDGNIQTIYTVTSSDTTFALTKKGHEMMCGYLIQRTEHPKLFIVENHKGLILPARNGISIENLDIFSYVNSKFVYVERHIRTQLSRLYHDITLQTCNVERQVLKTLITLAPLTPDEFAYQLMK